MKRTLCFMALLAGAVIFASCSRSNGSITMGSKSQFDSLSYALGNNVGAGLNRMMSDIPFDFDAMTEGVTEGALGTAKMTHPEALDTLRTFFYGYASGTRSGYCQEERDDSRFAEDTRRVVGRSRDVRERGGASVHFVCFRYRSG